MEADCSWFKAYNHIHTIVNKNIIKTRKQKLEVKRFLPLISKSHHTYILASSIDDSVLQGVS